MLGLAGGRSRSPENMFPLSSGAVPPDGVPHPQQGPHLGLEQWHGLSTCHAHPFSREELSLGKIFKHKIYQKKLFSEKQAENTKKRGRII